MLATVLLHVIPASRPVDLAFDLTRPRWHVIDNVDDLVIALLNVYHRGIAKTTGVVGLPTAQGVENGAVEHDAWVFALFAGHYLGGEVRPARISPVELAGR